MNDPTTPHRVERLPVRSLHVEVIDGPDKGKTATSSSILTIGTAEANDLTLTDETVSRHHVELERAADKVVIRDLQSTNGTVASGFWIETGRSFVPCRIDLGKTKIQISDGEIVEVELFGDDQLGGCLGRDPKMRQLMARAKRAAASNASVLLLGETGVGKEVIARAIHDHSPRREGPFEAVDCGSILPNLIASELFGHEKGAFTGADRRHLGAFERANGGTLFLDEIGELPSSLQTALLGALERRSFRRVGGSKTLTTDVRVISATNRDLRAEINQGTFRQDVYFRIAVILLRIPPLRERPDDIPMLIEHFLRDVGHRGPVEDVFPAKVMETLTSHRWPGNVRELRNAVEAAVVMGEPPELFEAAAPDSTQPPESDEAKTDPADDVHELPYGKARAVVLDRFEESYLTALLEKTDGNVSKASRIADMDRTHLTRLLKKRGLAGRD